MEINKSILIIILIAILLIHLIPNTLTQTAPLDQFEKKAKEFLDKKEEIEKLKEEESRKQFLKEQWVNLLSKHKVFGPIISSFKPIAETYNKTSPIINPIFKYAIGIEPSLSFFFLLTLSLWIAIIVIIYRGTSLVSIFSKRFHLIFALGLTIIISIIGITKAVSEIIINLVEKLTIWWIKLIVIIIIITFLLISTKITKIIEKYVEQYKKKSEEDIAREKLKASAKTAEAFTEGITNS